MQIDIARLDEMIARGAVRPGSWGDGHERACLMSAAVNGATSEADCAAQGWPLWLVEMVVWLFDSYPEDDAVARGRRLMGIIADAEKAGRDWADVYRRVRLNAILPIAMESIGDGDEPWRVECRRVVQWSIDNDGAPACAAQAAAAAWATAAAWAAEVAEVAWVVEAAEAAEAAGAAGAVAAARAAEAAWATQVARAAARDRIEAALIAACRGEREGR